MRFIYDRVICTIKTTTNMQDMPISSPSPRQHLKIVTVYPSKSLRKDYSNNKDIIYTAVVIISFLFTFAIFSIYDCFVGARQRKTMETALRTTRIISNLFPAAVRARLLEDAAQHPQDKSLVTGVKKNHQQQEERLDSSSTSTSGEPIADLFPSATIMFAE